MAQHNKRPSNALDGPDDAPQRLEGVLYIAPKDRVNFMKQERLRCVQLLCLRSKKLGRVPTSDDGKDVEDMLSRLDRFMRWLESSIEITPELKVATQIDVGLQLIFDKPDFHFNDSMKTRAKDLYERWEAQNWGRGELDAVEDSSEGEPGETNEAVPPSRRKVNAPSSGKEILGSVIRPPPADHPIFGVHGIMHGTVQKRTANRKDFILDNRYRKREAKVFGHNGLAPGAWWPMQLVALFNGAHGVKQGGIAGNAETGAYSIVVSGQYDDLDQDNGEVIFYSGSNSHENTDPNRPGESSRATQALAASLRTGRPVRVLRASKGKSRWAPTEGYRYDGLYRVVSEDAPLNKKGGMYQRFKLVREPGQASLDALKSRPSSRELDDCNYIHAGY